MEKYRHLLKNAKEHTCKSCNFPNCSADIQVKYIARITPYE